MAVGQWKKYYVHLAGDTGGSHQEFLFYLNRSRQSQVSTPAESDYVLIFCPVFSEPAREVEQALVNFPGGKFVVGTNQLLQLLKYPHYFCILMLAFVWKEKLFLRQETFHVAQPFSSLTKHSCVSLLRLQLVNPQSCWWCITSRSLSLETKHTWPAPMCTWPLTYCTTRENSKDASLIQLQWRRSSYWSKHPTKNKTERWVWFAYTIVRLCWTTQFDCCLTFEISFFCLLLFIPYWWWVKAPKSFVVKSFLVLPHH